jgi:hypothetical protein
LGAKIIVDDEIVGFCRIRRDCAGLEEIYHGGFLKKERPARFSKPGRSRSLSVQDVLEVIAFE